MPNAQRTACRHEILHPPRTRRRRAPWAVAALIAAGCAPPGRAPPAPASLAIWEPSPPEVVQAMLETAKVGPGDIVYDLGCGDGRIVIEAARRGARGVGVDIDPELVAVARRNARAAGVEERVTLRQEDALGVDLADATVVTLFLSREGNQRLAERLRQGLREGVRIVSHCHPMADWAPEAVVPVTAAGKEHKVYLWSARRAAMAPNLGPFVPTPIPVVRRMLEVAGVTDADLVYDLGCGDGRIVVEAAKRHGARAIGIEYDRRLCEEARARAEREGVAGKVTIRHEDVMEADFSDATVVTIYLLPASNARLLPKLKALRPGTRVVSHDYPIGDWKPIHKEVVPTNDAFEHVVRLWRIGE